MATTATALPINSLINSGVTAPTAAQGISSELGPDAFLKLLTTQLQNQDPLNPMDDTASIAQLAQFSAVQSTDDLKDAFASFQSNFAVMQSAGLLGQSVTVSTADASGNSSSISGTVKSIQVINGQPEFTMVDSSGNAITDGNGTPILFATSQILGIGSSGS
jgi:flagellar basal-body rod modification protein FlgD